MTMIKLGVTADVHMHVRIETDSVLAHQHALVDIDDGASSCCVKSPSRKSAAEENLLA